MNKKHFLALGLVALTFMLISTSSQAEERPIQIGLITPIQLVPEGTAIRGLRINLIYGRNTAITGLDLGLVNHTTSGMSKGLQNGFVGLAEGDFTGWQDNWLLNVTQGNFEGVQTGVFNHAKHMSGVQLGLVNSAHTLEGLQIGLLNFIQEGGTFPVFPIVNWSF